MQSDTVMADFLFIEVVQNFQYLYQYYTRKDFGQMVQYSHKMKKFRNPENK